MNSLNCNHISENVIFSITIIFVLSIFFISCSDKKDPDPKDTDQGVSISQRDYLTPEILCGTVQFSDGCSPKLDTLISFGIALIHHMTYQDAEYTFNKVIETDKDCFWGYWGKAMSSVHPLWPDIPDVKELSDGYVLCQNALSLAKTKKEKAYGTAVASYFKDGNKKTETERLIAFNEGWQAAAKELPQDIEARLFSVLSMLATASPEDKSYKIQREAGAIAEEVLKVIPDHPGAFHYAIHAYDYPPLAVNALRVARNYYKLAPEIPHALHMPTHIFTRLGYWKESIDLNLRSAEAAKKIPVKQQQLSAQYFHALDYLAYAYLQISAFNKAEEIFDLLKKLKGPFETSPITAYALAAIPGRIALERKEWKKAAEIDLHYYSTFPWKKYPQYEALIYFANGIGAGRSGKPETALRSLKKLEELQNVFQKTEANEYWISQIEIQKLAVKGWMLFSEHNFEKAVEIMISAAELEDKTEKNPVTPGSLLPAREMLGDLLLEIRKPEQALREYRLSLQNNPNRLNSLNGIKKAEELLKLSSL